MLFRKTPALRIRRYASPEPPFFSASAILPYGVRHDSPIAIDHLTMEASAPDRLEVLVCEDVSRELTASRAVAAPALVEATGNGETVFERGAATMSWFRDHEVPASLLVSLPAAVPEDAGWPDGVLIVSAWDIERATALMDAAARQPMPWGVIVPILFPVTTGAEALTGIAAYAAARGAGFLATAPLHPDQTVKQAVAQRLALGSDDDRYALLFHSQVEPLHVAADRHAAFAAAAHGLADFVLPPRWNERTNWNAATLLTLTATRMLSLELDLDLAASLARAARAVATLDKPIEAIARSASLSIIGGVEETAVEILTEWLEGQEPGFVNFVNDQWRLEKPA